MGLRPYLPLEGLCVLLAEAENHLGALPMAFMAVLFSVVWLRVGEVAGLRLVDIPVPPWLQF